MTDKQIIIDGKIIGCPCYIDRPLHRYHKGCLVQSQAFKEQQTEEKPILRCDEIKNCPIKENFKQLQCKTAECEKYEQVMKNIEEICLKDVHTFADGTQLRYDSLDDILDIISKAKGDINEAII